MRAVLAEQDPATRKRVAKALKDGGYEVQEAGTEKQLRTAIKEPLDLLVLDLEMPAMDPSALIATLRESLRNAPLIVFSGAQDLDAAETALESGASEYLLKPVNVQDFMLRLRLATRQMKTPAPLSVALPQLHDAKTGRMDAARVAEYLGIPLKQLADALGANYAALHKTPTAESAQDGLKPIKRSLEILDQVIGNETTIRAWLRSPHPDLGDRTPLDVILSGRTRALSALLENALSGIPS